MKPTLLIILKAPHRGRVKTRLATGSGEEVAVQIYRRLVERQMQAIPHDWPAEVHYAPAGAGDEMKAWLGERPSLQYFSQCEGCLGSRMSHAVLGAFSREATGVLLIGGDCVGLGSVQFEDAASGLAEADAVLGPTVDGGYYLLGLREPRLSVFQDIAWSTSTVAVQTRTRLATAGMTWRELPPLQDVDTAADWEAVKANF